MFDKEFWIEIVKKIELQSILVLFVTLLFGAILLYKDNSLSSPAGIGGAAAIAVGLLYTGLSFHANQLREDYQHFTTQITQKYEHIIDQQNAHLERVTISQKNIETGYQKLTTITSQQGGTHATKRQVGRYVESSIETGTQNALPGTKD